MYYLKRVRELGLNGISQSLKHRFKRWIFATRNRPRVSSGAQFYQDIIIPSRKMVGFDALYPDIKDSWEPARLQHLSQLGKAYQQTRDQQYVHDFEQQVSAWIEQNPYLTGLNWVCTMEVAIRAVNLIEGIESFETHPTAAPQDERERYRQGEKSKKPFVLRSLEEASRSMRQSLSLDFQQQFIKSLHQHATYINHNWEWSDKPNNHYLADFLGYLYLCFFFKDIPAYAQQQNKVIKQFLAQWQQQINADGSCYEGSTAYHRLDTEMMGLFIKLCERNTVQLPEWVYDMYARMMQFLDDCTDERGNLVMIGDDDSGRIIDGAMYPLKSFETPDGLLSTSGIELMYPFALRRAEGPSERVTNGRLITYPDFGLTIIKKSGWHITLRHPVFNKRQPTGHFHQDALSITLSLDGIPIFVDPGSYVYTANGSWRNLFRSWQRHNTFHAASDWRDLTAYDLFQLPQQEHVMKGIVTQRDSQINVSDYYRQDNVMYERIITFDAAHEILQVHDRVTTLIDTPVIWRFIVHPDVSLIQQDDTTWLILYAGKTLATCTSSLVFNKTDAYFASSYGVKRLTCMLTSTTLVNSSQEERFVVRRYLQC